MVKCFLDCGTWFCRGWRSMPFGAFLAFVFSAVSWHYAHKKVDFVVDGLYGEWSGADGFREKIIALDVPFGVVVLTNFIAMIISVFAMERCRNRIFANVLSKDGTPTCGACCLGPSLFCMMSILIIFSLAVVVVYSYLLLSLYFVLKVLAVFCLLPWGMLPMVDDIIDNLDHPICKGLDLVKFCPEHRAVDQDALELWFACLGAMISQAGMLACIHSSCESMNLSMFDMGSVASLFGGARSDEEEDGDSQSDEDESPESVKQLLNARSDEVSVEMSARDRSRSSSSVRSARAIETRASAWA